MPQLPQLLAFVLISLAVVGCSQNEAIYTVEHASVSGPGGQLTDDQVHNAILTSLQTRDWVVQEEMPNKIIAKQTFRKHSATIQINYSQTGYSLLYRESENLGYDGSEIHRNYNKRIRQLEAEINRQLQSA